VRLAAVRQAPVDAIRGRLDDPEAEVRRAARERLQQGAETTEQQK